MLKFKTSCAVLANLSSNLLNEVGLSFFRYFEVGLRVCDIVVNKYVRYLISWWVLVVIGKATHYKFRVLIDTEKYESMYDILLPKEMCSESRDFFIFWGKRDNVSETVQDRDIIPMED